MENIIKIDVITGFIGAGKTTFIRKYIQYLQNKGEKVLVIENEYGLAGIDRDLLAYEGIHVKELDGGCLCCTLKPGIHYYLNEAIRDGYDRVIFEPLGPYHLDTFFEVVEDPSLQTFCKCGSVITIVAPDVLEYMEKKVEDFIFSQLLSAGAIVFRQEQEDGIYDVSTIIEEIKSRLKDKGIENPLAETPIWTKSWSEFVESDFDKLEGILPRQKEHNLLPVDHGVLYKSTQFTATMESVEKIEAFLSYCFTQKCGDIIRIKGFVECEDGHTYAISATKNSKHIEKSEVETPVINVIGNQIIRKEIKMYLCFA